MSLVLSSTDSFVTTAPPAAVWTALATPGRWPEVLTDLQEGLIEPPGSLCEGAVIRTFARPGTKAIDMTYRVILAEPERRLSFRSEGNDWRGATDYTIEADGRTRVTLSVAIEPRTFWPRLAVRFWRGLYQDQLAANTRSRMLAMLKLAETIAREAART
jgi:hypothetical protein